MPADSKALERTAAADLQTVLSKILANPLRGRIVMQLGKGDASPKELSEALDEDFQRVCAQVRYLKNLGAIELVAEDSRRGGVQHFYKLIIRPRLDANEWEQLPKEVRESHSTATLQVIVSDFWDALASGDFDSHRHRVLLQKPMLVDEQGMREADESALRHLDELERIEAASLARRIDSGESGIQIKTVTIVHPAARSKPD